MICRSSQSKERVEWQADFYASCVLMPRKMVTEAWRREMGTDDPIIYDQVKHKPVARRPNWRGPRLIKQVLRDEFEPDHTYLFNQVAREFAPTFGVSIQAMRIRLERLGMLRRELPRQRSLVVGF